MSVKNNPIKNDSRILNNAVIAISPYKIEGGIFAFDDPNTGLIREPFIGGANKYLHQWAGENESCTIAFSYNPIPNYDVKLNLQDSDMQLGSNYVDEQGYLVWLCPALFRYFTTAPDKLYVKHICF